MKILWITNTVFPDLAKKLGLPQPISGGWMYALADQLANFDEITLAVASTYSQKNLCKYVINGITYYLLPYKNKKRYPKYLEKYWKNICDEFNPDIVHIHGTEYPRALACMRACPKLKYIVSIQGMNTTHYQYTLAGIDNMEIIKNITFRDIIKRDTLFNARRKRRANTKYEKEYLEKCSYILGRTKWDYANVKSINKNVKYEFCNEILRNEFYTAKHWNLENINRHSIFLSQASSPLKGLHIVLKAINLLKDEFPDIKIRIGGTNIIKKDTLLNRLKLSGYGKYINTLLKKYDLKYNIEFLGFLNVNEMITEYQKAHIFICPSSIENSPNSIGEAQLIGTPVIASYVGGIPDMVKDNETGLLYRFEEYAMLAENIRQIFNNDKLAINLSENGQRSADKRHNYEKNIKQMLQIYESILSVSK